MSEVADHGVDLTRRAALASLVALPLLLLSTLWLDGLVLEHVALLRAWFGALPVGLQYVIDNAHWAMYVACLSTLIFGLVRRQRRALLAVGAYLSAQLLFSMGVVRGLKILVARPRPYASDVTCQMLSLESACHSFPSGHSADVVVGLAAVDVLSRSASLRWIALALVLCTMGSRVVQGLHYPSDVVTGAALAYLGTLGVVGLARRVSIWSR